MIINITRQNVLAKRKKYCRTNLQKFMGLRFHPEPNNKGFIFPFEKNTRISLDMLFVFYPIDVLWLDRNMEVVEMKENFRPFTIHTPRKHARYVIELPKGTIKRTKTRKKDKIDF